MLSGKRDSNSRPQPWQGCALPTELFPQIKKCPRQESNLHVSQHSHLKRARLPFRHVGKWKRISERKTRLELATPTLARLCSTNWAISAFWRRFFRNASAKVLLFPKLTNFFLFFFQYSKIICSYMFFYLILQKLCVYSHTLPNNINEILTKKLLSWLESQAI